MLNGLFFQYVLLQFKVFFKKINYRDFAKIQWYSVSYNARNSISKAISKRMYLLWILKMDFHRSKLVLNQWFLTDWAISTALFPSSLTDSSACSNLLLKESNFSFQLLPLFSFYLAPFYNFYLFTSILNLLNSSFWFP